MLNNSHSTARNGERLLFARAFLRHPLLLGSVIPSSRFLVKGVLDRIDWGRARTIVEYGPGVGTITGEILSRMHAEGTLVAIEMNPEFVRFLRTAYPDRRLRVVEGSAEHINDTLRRLGLAHADYIVSGIPFSTLPAARRENILHQSRAAQRARC